VDAVTINQQIFWFELLSDKAQSVQEAMNAVTRKQVTVLCEVMTTVDRLYKNVEVALTRNLQTVNCEVLTESVYTLQDTSGCSDKEPTDVIV